MSVQAAGCIRRERVQFDRHGGNNFSSVGARAIKAESPKPSWASWLKQRGVRDKVIIATKVGMEMGAGPEGTREEPIS